MSNSAKTLYAVESIEVVVRNVQHMYIMPCMKFYKCNRQTKQVPLKYRVNVNSGLRNIFIKMEVIIRRLEGALEIEDRFSTMCLFFRYNRIMCVYNRTYICYGYRQPYHHHTKYIYM
jgi:hypothetical protein